MTKKNVPADNAAHAEAASLADDLIAAGEQEQLRELIRIKTQQDRSALSSALLSLQSSNPEVRARAADALAEIGEAADVTVESGLFVLLADIDPTVRYSAIQAIGVLRFTSASSQITELLQKDSDELVRVAAAEVLGYLEYAAALPSLLAALNDSYVVVRSFAACSIGLLATSKNSDEVHATVWHAEKLEENLVVKMELLIADYRIGYQECKQRLSELLLDAANLTEDNVTPVLNGIQFLLEHRPPSRLQDDVEFFSAIIHRISHQFPSEQYQAQKMIRLLTATPSAD